MTIVVAYRKPIGMIRLVHREEQGVKTWIKFTDISPIRSECDVADWIEK